MKTEHRFQTTTNPPYQLVNFSMTEFQLSFASCCFQQDYVVFIWIECSIPTKWHKLFWLMGMKSWALRARFTYMKLAVHAMLFYKVYCSLCIHIYIPAATSQYADCSEGQNVFQLWRLLAIVELNARRNVAMSLTIAGIEWERCVGDMLYFISSRSANICMAGCLSQKFFHVYPIATWVASM